MRTIGILPSSKSWAASTITPSRDPISVGLDGQKVQCLAPFCTRLGRPDKTGIPHHGWENARIAAYSGRHSPCLCRAPEPFPQWGLVLLAVLKIVVWIKDLKQRIEGIQAVVECFLPGIGKQRIDCRGALLSLLATSSTASKSRSVSIDPLSSVL